MMRAAQFANSFSFSSCLRRSEIVGFTAIVQKTLPLTQFFILYGYVSDNVFVEGFVSNNALESQFAAKLWWENVIVNSFLVFRKCSFKITRKQTSWTIDSVKARYVGCIKNHTSPDSFKRRRNWKWPFHLENASNISFLSTLHRRHWECNNQRLFWNCVWGKLRQRNHKMWFHRFRFTFTCHR